MSKKYKVKHVKDEEEFVEEEEKELSKKELYDLNKQKKLKEKEKSVKKVKNNKKKKKKSTYQTNMVGRIFAIVMLILMIGSVIATISPSSTLDTKPGSFLLPVWSLMLSLLSFSISLYASSNEMLVVLANVSSTGAIGCVGIFVPVANVFTLFSL